MVANKMARFMKETKAGKKVAGSAKAAAPSETEMRDKTTSEVSPQQKMKEMIEAKEAVAYHRGYNDATRKAAIDSKKAEIDLKNHIYPVAYALGRFYGKKAIVTAIETRLAEIGGYQDRQKWAFEAKMPAWWIGVLMECWEPLGPKDILLLEKTINLNPPEVDLFPVPAELSSEEIAEMVDL